MNDCSGFIDLAKQTSKRKSGEIVARLLIDTQNSKVLCIWADINHPEYLAEHLKTTVEELKKSPERAAPFVGAAVQIDGESIAGMIIGISGLEILMQKFKKPFHSKSQVVAAKDILINCLTGANISFKPNFRVEVKFM